LVKIKKFIIARQVKYFSRKATLIRRSNLLLMLC